MRLEYPMYNNGMYRLRNEDFDPIASMVLNEYAPDTLKNPQPTDIDYLIEECFYLNVIKAHITLEGNILGMMVFEDTPFKYYDNKYQLVEQELKGSTMLIDLSLSGDSNYPRERFTKAHEVSHWICHRSLHSSDKLPYEFRKLPYVACRNTNIEQYKYSDEFKRTELEWEEWQADKLAAALLMPKDSFITVSQAYMKKHGLSEGFLIKGYDEVLSKKIIAEIAKFFMVSKQAAQIRMSQLGLIV